MRHTFAPGGETCGPARIAVVGAGPAGLYAVTELVESGYPVKIDVFERLPSPFGLVRYGVAPDNQKIKSVGDIYLLCRRGPTQMKFTPVELRELGELSILTDDGQARGSGRYEVLAVNLVLHAVGYQVRPKAESPYDSGTETRRNRGGRLVDGQGHILPGEYVTGWAKRGPSGVIGTNRADAAQTVKNLLAGLPDLAPPRHDDDRTVMELLEHRGVKVVDWARWLRLDSHEIEAGRRRGSPRVKTPDLAAMLDRSQPLAHEEPTDDGASTPSPAGRTSGW